MLQVNWPVITIHPYSKKFATGELKLDDSPDLSAGQVPVVTIGRYLDWQSVDIKADTWSIYMLRESRLSVSRHVIQVSSKTVSWHLADTSTDMLWSTVASVSVDCHHGGISDNRCLMHRRRSLHRLCSYVDRETCSSNCCHFQCSLRCQQT